MDLPEVSAEDVGDGARRLPNLANVRVLVVEDNADAQDLLREILERCGATECR
jgi:hypothetical protein